MNFNVNDYFNESIKKYYNISNEVINKYKNVLSGSKVSFGSIRYNDENKNLNFKLYLPNDNIKYNRVYIDENGLLNIYVQFMEYFSYECMYNIKYDGINDNLYYSIIFKERKNNKDNIYNGIYYFKDEKEENNRKRTYSFYDKNVLNALSNYIEYYNKSVNYEYPKSISFKDIIGSDDKGLNQIGFKPDLFSELKVNVDYNTTDNLKDLIANINYNNTLLKVENMIEDYDIKDNDNLDLILK